MERLLIALDQQTPEPLTHSLLHFYAIIMFDKSWPAQPPLLLLRTKWFNRGLLILCWRTQPRASCLAPIYHPRRNDYITVRAEKQSVCIFQQRMIARTHVCHMCWHPKTHTHKRHTCSWSLTKREPTKSVSSGCDFDSRSWHHQMRQFNGLLRHPGIERRVLESARAPWRDACWAMFLCIGVKLTNVDEPPGFTRLKPSQGPTNLMFLTFL